jgi:hypothetical protein
MRCIYDDKPRHYCTCKESGDIPVADIGTDVMKATGDNIFLGSKGHYIAKSLCYISDVLGMSFVVIISVLEGHVFLKNSLTIFRNRTPHEGLRDNTIKGEALVLDALGAHMWEYLHCSVCS